MTLQDLLLAAALLLAPPDTPARNRHFDWAPWLQGIAIGWEILDPREVRYTLCRPPDFAADLNTLRRRRLELADAPPASDAHRFPDRSLVNEYLAFNREYRQQLDMRTAGDPARYWQLREALQEADRLYLIWDAVRDARCEYYFVTVRRQALKRLREMLGEEAYYGGQLPPYVPLHRFHSIRQP